MANQTFVAQVQTLVRLGYPAMFDMSEASFVESLSVLGAHLPPECPTPEPHLGVVPFVIVINAWQAPPSTTLPLILRRGKTAIERLHPKSTSDFVAIPEVELPTGDAYLLLDVDRGASTLNVTPDAAYVAMAEVDRSPLTIQEGIALLTHFPEFLQPNNCFSMLASRCGDKRVPALWLSESRPKLGWCWAGNPHTWLGSASCKSRVGSAALRVQALSDA